MAGIDPVASAHRLLAPRVAYLIGTLGEGGRPNLIPVSNVTSVSTDPQQVAAAVFKKWETFHNLMGSVGFTVNVPTSSQSDAVWKLGAKYSRFPHASPKEKIRASGIEVDLEVSAYGPVVPTGIGWAACRTIARIDLSGNHGIFVGEVDNVWFNPDFLRSDGTPLGPVKPVMQQTGNLFTTAADEMSTMEYFRE